MKHGKFRFQSGRSFFCKTRLPLFIAFTYGHRLWRQSAVPFIRRAKVEISPVCGLDGGIKPIRRTSHMLESFQFET
jgi:hypothetical protein